MRRSGGKGSVRGRGPNRKPWDRRHGESPRQFQAFAAFRDLGPGRSVASVARAFHFSRGHVDRWAKDHDWRRRAAAWDEHLDRVRQRHLEAVAALGADAKTPPEDLIRAASVTLETLSALMRRLIHARGASTPQGSPVPERAG
jgi:hypothetical protein